MNTTSSTDDEPLTNSPRSRRLVVVSILVFAAVVSANGFRVVKDFNTPVSGQFDWDRLGYCDFHVATYYASKAFRDGVNPFSHEVVEKYPFERELPLYSPVMLVLHIPFTLMPLKIAAGLHFVCNIGMITLLAWMALNFSGAVFRWPHVLFAASFILITRCGHTTIFTGYVTAELVIGTVLALHFGKDKPLLGGIGLVVAGFKPTYAIPLVFLLLCRKQWKAVTIGVALALAGLFLGFLWLALHGSWSEVIQSVSSTQEVHVSQESEMPVNTQTRVDLLAIIAKWTDQNPGTRVHLIAMVPILLLGGLGVWRLGRFECSKNAASLSSMLVVVTMLVSLYHHVYDCLLLVVPLAGLWFQKLPDWKQITWRTRWFLGGLSFALLFSYWSSRIVLGRLDLSVTGQHLVTSVNAAFLVLMFICLILIAFQARFFESQVKPEQPNANS